MDKSLNTYHISTNLRNFEAARNSFFVFQVAPTELTNLYHPNFNPDSGEPGANDVYDGNIASEALRLNVVKSSVPNFSVGTESFRRGNDVVKYATVPEFADGSIVVDDIVGVDTKSILYSWLYLAYNPHTRKGGRMRDYKKTCTLIEYTQDYEQIRTWTLEGCFVTKIDEDDFDRENDGKRQLSVSISFDRAMMELPVTE